MNGMLSKSMEIGAADVKKCITCFHHLCQPYRSFGKRQRTILSGTTCAVRVQSGVRSTKFKPCALKLDGAIGSIGMDAG
jgi:hypothetical protein